MRYFTIMQSMAKLVYFKVNKAPVSHSCLIFIPCSILPQCSLLSIGYTAAWRTLTTKTMLKSFKKLALFMELK